MRQSQNWNFVVFFNFKDANSRARAERQREENLIHSREAFDRSAKFSAVARENSETSLRLRGFARMKHTISQSNFKKTLGKCCHCNPASFGDVMNMIQCFNIDRDTVLTGSLCAGGDSVLAITRFMKREGNRKTTSEVEHTANHSLINLI